MEEHQIQEFIHRVSLEDGLREELAKHPDEVLMRESFSPRVATIIRRLIPHLTAFEAVPTTRWWF